MTEQFSLNTGKRIWNVSNSSRPQECIHGPWLWSWWIWDLSMDPIICPTFYITDVYDGYPYSWRIWPRIYAGAKLLQSCPTLCDPIDGSPPGFPVSGILQARTLEWAAISFSNAWKWKVKVKSLSRVWLLATPWTAAYQAPPHMGSSRQEYRSGLPLPSPRIFIDTDILQFSSIAQSCLTLCDPTDCSIPGFHLHHQLPELAQTHVHWVGDAIQPSHSLSFPSPPALNLSQHQGLFQGVSSLHLVAKVLELQLQHRSFKWLLRVDFL